MREHSGILLTTLEAEAKGLLEPKSLRPGWAMYPGKNQKALKKINKIESH
jgi:hypothetical protein